MCLHNAAVKEIKIPITTIVGQVQSANALPKMLTPKRSSLVEMRAKWVDEESLLKHIDLSIIQELSKEDQEAARSLAKEFSCVCSRNDFDLGRMTGVKHEIKITDYTPF